MARFRFSPARSTSTDRSAPGTLDVSAIGTLGGLGLWDFSGPAVFQSGSTFDVTLDGTSPGTQYTQLVDSDATAGVNLGNCTLAASVGYEYEQGDQYTIVSSPVIQGVFKTSLPAV